MNKFEILNEHKQKRLSEEEAMAKLGMSRKGVRHTMRTYGPHLQVILRTIGKLDQPGKRDQTAVKRDLAQQLNVTYNQLNRMLRVAGVESPTPKVVQMRHEKHQNAQKRREKVQKTVEKLAKGRISAETACETLEIGPRQVARLLSDLVTSHGYEVPEFKALPKKARSILVTQWRE